MFVVPNIYKTFALVLILTLGLASCGLDQDQITKDEQQSRVSATQPEGVSTHKVASVPAFERDIKPIIEHKCVACHGCYDAPCQLKMESNDGLVRGASQILVYDASRLETISPTRLHVDADGEKAWRDKGFYDVLHDQSARPLMQKMLDLGRDNALAPGAKITKDDLKLGSEREHSCAKPEDFDDYAQENPLGGMPLAVAGLTDAEYQTMSAWITGGAPVAASQAEVSKNDRRMLDSWEAWLNSKDLGQQLVSRYLYEHLILGHLYLAADTELNERLKDKDDTTTKFFRLVRSFTPPGEDIDIVASALPNDDPGKNFYYRLQAINETLVYKNHIPYRFDKQRMQRYKDVFFDKPYSLKILPGYSYKERANPFMTFAAIPARARYEFLLQDAEYFIRNFIRGPVCHGPIATDVIRDQFWTMFEAPESELYVNNVEYRSSVTPLLGLPGEKDDLSDLGPQWDKYSKQRNQYLKLRQQAYNKNYPKGSNEDAIWNGEGENPNAFLTVFRHHNSASVTTGWRGDIPRTAWVLDYPLFERTYYELVVGFNVFGSLSHQLQTRLYFDLIRNGGEQNFLRFIPTEQREKMYEFWYQGAGKIKVLTSYHKLDTKSPTAITFESQDPKRELFAKFFEKYPQLTKSEDLINRCGDGCLQAERKISQAEPAGGDKQASTTTTAFADVSVTQALRQIASRSASSLPVVSHMPEVTLLAIKPGGSEGNSANGPSGQIKAYTIIRNRMHSNVAFLLGESLRYQEEQDTLTVLPEISGSYPNLLLSVNESDLSNMVDKMLRVKNKKDFEGFIDAYAVRRMQTRFWGELHSFTDYLDTVAPIEAGVMDINRYGYW